MRAACGCRLGSIPGRLVALWYYKRICLPSASSTYFFGRRFIMQELCLLFVHTRVYTYMHTAWRVCAISLLLAGNVGFDCRPSIPCLAVCSRSPNKKGERTAGAPRQNLFAQTTLHGWAVPPHAIGKSRMNDKKQHESITPPVLWP